MYLYVYRNYTGGRELSEKLLRQSLARYAAAEDLADSRCISGEIFRSDRGKPYIPASDIEFSISHTSNLWVCLVGKVPVGIDVQIMRRHKWETIAKRYYTSDEQTEIQSSGREGFYQIWTRKEAYVKYTGRGLNSDLKNFSTLEAQGIEFIDLTLAPDIKCSCCMKEKEEIWIRNLV